MSLFTQQGWQCLVCQRVYSPTTSICFYCPPTVETAQNTSPPHRKWVGLTNDERCSFVDFYWEKDLLSLFELLGIVEAKLKQKNGYAEEKNT